MLIPRSSATNRSVTYPLPEPSIPLTATSMLSVWGTDLRRSKITSTNGFMSLYLSSLCALRVFAVVISSTDLSRRHALQVEGGVERADGGARPLADDDGDAAVVEDDLAGLTRSQAEQPGEEGAIDHVMSDDEDR